MIKGYARLTGKFPSGGIDKCKILKNPPVNDNWCAIYDDSVVMIDIDSYDHEGNKELKEPINGKPKHEAILKYLDKFDYKYNLISNPYTGNVHIIMKKPKDFEIDGNKNDWYCALGIRIEVKVTKIWENMKVNGVERDFMKGSFESELDELACGLFPIQKSMTSKKCDFSVIDMSEGDGRNNAFSALAFKLGAILGADHTKEVLTAMNNYVLESPLDEKEMEVILRDETLEKIDRKPSGKRMNYKLFHEYFSNLGVTIKYNEISNKIDYFNLPSEEYKLLENKPNSMPLHIRDNIRNDLNINVTEAEIITQLRHEADLNSYNPVTDYFNSLVGEADESLFNDIYDILDVSDTFKQLLIKKWFVQCVAMAFNDIKEPYSAEGVLILSGREGLGKTSFFRLITPDPTWFKSQSEPIVLGNKDIILGVLKYWIVELGEIDTTLKRKEGQFKSFLTTSKDSLRRPYGRSEEEIIRRTSFCGTTNKDRFLTNESGYRRFWVVPVKTIDLERLRSFHETRLNDFWLGCYNLYKSGFSYYLSSSELDDLQRDLINTKDLSPCEVDIMNSFNFDCHNWKWWKASEVKKERMDLSRYSAQEVGRKLKEMCEYIPQMKAEPVSKKNPNKGLKYWLPKYRIPEEVH